MVDDHILLPDGREAIAAVIADAAGIARRVGLEFQIRAVEIGDLAHLVECKHAVHGEHAVVGNCERALHEAPQFDRHSRLDVEPDHRTAPPPFERGFEQPHQVFGFFENFDFGVAGDAERAEAFYGVTREQLGDEQAGDAFDRNQPRFAALAGFRQPHKALDPVGHANERVHRLAVFAAGQLQRDSKAEIGNERERMRRIDGKRRQQRKDVSEKVVFEPGLLGARHVGTVDQNNAGRSQLRPQLAPLRLLVLHKHHHGFGDPSELLGGSEPFRALGADAFPHLRAETGHAHHEKFIEIVCRDRQELEPLEQRISAVRRFPRGHGD